MEQGIGRAGYRLLAVGALTLGVIGLAVLLLAYPVKVEVLSLLAAGAIFLGLLTIPLFTMVLTRKPKVFEVRRRAETPSEPETTEPAQAEPARQPAKRIRKRRWSRRRQPTEVGRRPDATTGMDFEYGEAASAAPPHASRPTPSAHAAVDVVGDTEAGLMEFVVPVEVAPPPTRPVSQQLPPTRTAPRGPPRPTTDDRRRHLATKYTEEAPMVRDIMTTSGQTAVYEQIPEVDAELQTRGDHPDLVPEGMVRGRCGQCKSGLLAPTARPIRLRCPRCSKTTTLRS